MQSAKQRTGYSIPPSAVIPPFYMKYLDPKIDLVFKRVFGEHEDVAMDFLNAMLPLNSPIKKLEYVSGELPPEREGQKHSIIDVRCRDAEGREFLVEMQNRWEAWFVERVLYGAVRVYGNQLERGDRYEVLTPVYSLAILNCVFKPETDEWRHHYKMCCNEKPCDDITFLEAVLVELPKAPRNGGGPRDLWTRFLSETNEKIAEAAPELLAYPPVQRALDLTRITAFTKAEQWAYEREMDAIRLQLSLEYTSRDKDRKLRDLNEEVLRQMEVMDEQAQALKEQMREVENKARELEDKDRALEDKDRALEDKDRALEEKNKAVAAAQQMARSAEERAMRYTARTMHENGVPLDLIAKVVKEDVDTVKEWLNLL